MVDEARPFICIVCGVEKPAEQFPFPPSKKTREKRCRQCKADYLRDWRARNVEHVRAQQKKERQSDIGRQRMRAYKLRVAYGLTFEDVDRMIEEQDGACAICRLQPVGRDIGRRSDSGRTCVDHDHVTGTVRGLLCLSCNLLLGYANDDVATLGRAIDYLKEHTQ